MKIITATTSKGGTGKTTVCKCLAEAGAYRGKRVLCIDLDPQGNLSFSLGADTDLPTATSYDLITGRPITQIQENHGIDIIPASLDLATLESGSGTARRLEQALEPLKASYDYVFVDTPATAGELIYNTLQACTDVIIPLEASIYSLQALYQINDICREIQATNPNLAITGFVLNRYDGRSNLSKQMKEAICDRAGEMGIPYLGAIRKGVAIEEATALQQPLYEYAPNSNPAKDFLLLFDSIDKTNRKKRR